MKASKAIQAAVNKSSVLSEYYTEICDGKVQHWVHTHNGYIFREQECGTVCGFSVREVLSDIKDVVSEEEFYGAAE